MNNIRPSYSTTHGTGSSIITMVTASLGVERVAEAPAVGGEQAALGRGDEGGGEAGLRDPAPLLGPRLRAHDEGRLHHHPQRPAPALRRDVPQLAAARLLEDGPVREHGLDHVAAPARNVPGAAGQRTVRDGLPRRAVARGFRGAAGHGEQGGRRRENETAGGGATRHSFLALVLVSSVLLDFFLVQPSRLMVYVCLVTLWNLVKPEFGGYKSPVIKYLTRVATEFGGNIVQLTRVLLGVIVTTLPRFLCIDRLLSVAVTTLTRFLCMDRRWKCLLLPTKSLVRVI
jgi:hypothetical protein